MFRDIKAFSKSTSPMKKYFFEGLLITVFMFMLLFTKKMANEADPELRERYISVLSLITGITLWSFDIANVDFCSPNSGKLSRTFPDAAKRVRIALMEDSLMSALTVTLSCIISAVMCLAMLDTNFIRESLIIAFSVITAGGIFHLNTAAFFKLKSRVVLCGAALFGIAAVFAVLTEILIKTADAYLPSMTVLILALPALLSRIIFCLIAGKTASEGWYLK